MSRRNVIVFSIGVAIAMFFVLVILVSSSNVQKIIILVLAVLVLIVTFVAVALTFFEYFFRSRIEQRKSELKEITDAVEAAQQRKRREDEQRKSNEREQKRIEELVLRYRDNLRHDPELSQIKILEMLVPTDLMTVYVQLRLHQDTRRDELDSALIKAEKTHDPNIILRTSLQEIEHRVGSALDPGYAIHHFKHCVILGNPGAGKTTLLKYLAIKAADGSLNELLDVIPIHIDLHVFANSGEKGLLSFAATQWEKRYGFPRNDAARHIEKVLKKGSALVLLDALDEALVGGSVGQAEQSYSDISQDIRQLTIDYPSAYIAVTARTAGYQQRFPLMDFAELEILEFSADDIEQFIKKWFNGYSERQGLSPDELMRTLRKTAALRALASNPLLLAMMALIYEQNKGELPKRRADVYKSCVELLLKRWNEDKDRKLFSEFPPYKKQQLLEEVAWDYHKQRKRYFPSNELLGLIKRFLPAIGLPREKNEMILDEISLGTGLLVQPAMYWYAFLHLTIQEYFVSLVVEAHNEAGRIELLKHIDDPWWEEVILLYVSRARDASPFLKALCADKQYVDASKLHLLFLSHLVLAGHCLATDPTIRDAVLRDEITGRLLTELRKTPFSLTRQQLAEALAGLNDRAVNETLIEMLYKNDDRSATVRVSVARALGLFGNQQVMEELLLVLFDEQVDNEVRSCIAGTIGTSKVYTAVPRLLKGLKNRWMSYDVRLSIAQALGAFIDDKFSLEIIKLLKQPEILKQPGKEDELRCALVDALGASEVRTVVSDLLEIYGDESPGSTFSWHVIIALAALGRSQELMECLSWLKPSENADPRSDLYITLKVQIVHALGALRQPSHDLKRYFRDMLSDERIHWEIRVGLACVLEVLGNRTDIEDLVPLIAQKGQIDRRVRAAIATVVGSLGDKRVIRPLQRLDIQRAEDPRVYRSLVTAIGRLGELAVVPLLLGWISQSPVYAGLASDPELSEEHTITVAERLNILDALQRLSTLDRLQANDRHKLFDALLKIANSRNMDSSLRKQVILFLPTSILTVDERSQVEQSLEELLGDQRVLDEAHRALWMIRRRWQEKIDDKTPIL